MPDTLPRTDTASLSTTVAVVPALHRLYHDSVLQREFPDWDKLGNTGNMPYPGEPQTDPGKVTIGEFLASYVEEPEDRSWRDDIPRSLVLAQLLSQWTAATFELLQDQGTNNLRVRFTPEPVEVGIPVSVSPALREHKGRSALAVPSGAYLTWLECLRDAMDDTD